jgi:uncharacterized protein
MSNPFAKKSWSPYLVGAGIGVLSWFAVASADRLLGSLTSSLLSGDRETFTVQPMWQGRFGPSRTKRIAVALLGGAIMIIGARLASGCTSGHGISGNLQLAVSSWLWIVLIAAAGLVAAWFAERGHREVDHATGAAPGGRSAAPS